MHEKEIAFCKGKYYKLANMTSRCQIWYGKRRYQF